MLSRLLKSRNANFSAATSLILFFRIFGEYLDVVRGSFPEFYQERASCLEIEGIIAPPD
jgi:hypothetical protein